MKRLYFLLTLLVVGTLSLRSNAQVLQADSLALVDFYNATGGPNWTDKGNWLTGPVSTWANVTVANGRVTKLTVYLNNMSGTIPASIGQLTELVEFRIQGDETNRVWVDIHGSIPAELWNCTKIEILQIKFTNITGNIPAGIEKMTALKEINFQATYLGCEIPAEIFNLPNLIKVYLHEGNFIGKVPASVVNATKLQRLYLQKNKLEAGLPYVELPAANKAKVDLTGNYFSFADVKQYYDAKANYAAFTSDYQYARATAEVKVDMGVPYTMNGEAADAEGYAWFKNSETVPVGTDATQDVTLNSFADEATYTCKAQSTLVPGCDLRSIYNLKLNMTQLEADSLALVDFYNSTGGPNWTDKGNWLTGPVSTWANVTVANGRVTKLTVYLNNMSGTIPASIGQLTELVEFRIQGDETNRVWVDIHGGIPAELWNCTKIEILQIKFTNITGNIPAGIEKMTALKEINFQATYLGCEIPAEIFNLPNLIKAYLHEGNFTGKVPASVVNATKLQRLYLQKNKLEAGLPYVELPAANKAKVDLTGNYFSFADVKQYYDAKANYAGFTCDYQYAQDPKEVTAAIGSSVSFELNVADGEMYSWFKDEATTPVSSDEKLTIPAVSKSDNGTYLCKVQSSLVPNFDIRATFVLNGGIAYPEMVSATTSTDGKTVTLTFDMEIDGTSIVVSDFSILVSNNSSVISTAIAGASGSKEIVLTLSTAIPAKTATVSVSYIPGTLKGLNGGAVAAFGPISVTNNVKTGIPQLGISLKTYPNPVVDVLNIQSSAVVSNIDLLDLSGRKIKEISNLSNNSISIQLSDITKGVYILSVKTDKGVFSRRITLK